MGALSLPLGSESPGHPFSLSTPRLHKVPCSCVSLLCSKYSPADAPNPCIYCQRLVFAADFLILKCKVRYSSKLTSEDFYPLAVSGVIAQAVRFILKTQAGFI